MWVKCKYPMLISSVEGISVSLDFCLTCEASYCPNKIKALEALLPEVIDEFPESFKRLAQYKACPLSKKSIARCTAATQYCKYVSVCPVHNYTMNTTIYGLKEVNMLLLLPKKTKEDPSATPYFIEALDQAPLNHTEAVLEIKYKLIPQQTFVPIEQQKTSKGRAEELDKLKHYTLVDKKGVERSIKELLDGKLKELYIVNKTLVPSVSVKKVPVDPAPRKQTRKRRVKK